MHKKYLKQLSRKLDLAKQTEYGKKTWYEPAEWELKRQVSLIPSESHLKRMIEYQKSQSKVMHVQGNIRNISVTVHRKRFKV
jgi:hypothetical protein